MLLATRQRTLSNRETFTLRVLPTIAVAVSFLLVTYVAWRNSNLMVVRERENISQNEAQRLESNIAGQLQTYEEALRGYAGLLRINGQDITKQEWLTYSESTNLSERYSGIVGFGFTQVIRNETLNDQIVSIRNRGVPDFSISPEGTRELYSPVVFLAPDIEINRKAAGFDMYSEPIRREAMNTAIDENQSIMTGLVTLVQDTRFGRLEPGFLIYKPVYDESKPIGTKEERRAAIMGFTYGAFRARNFVNTAVDKTYQSSYQLYDGDTTNQDKLLYEDPSFKSIDDRHATTAKRVVTLFGRQWTLLNKSPDKLVPSALRSLPARTLSSNLSLSIVLPALLYYLLTQRTRSLVRKKEQEVQSAKDELLSLAAHQLRTPATAVKQYIAMMIEGYSGALTDAQLTMLHKAFSSNERQLKTVNEMLYVANADAGELNMVYKKVDLRDLVTEAAEELQAPIEERKHKVTVTMPDSPVWLNADALFIRMSIANIISNAVKYTQEHGSIVISVTRRGQLIYTRIRDNGVGISKPDQKLLFKKFVRIHNTFTSQTIGSGLGLYLANKLVQLHGGKINVWSRPGKGTAFTIILPRPERNKHKSKSVKKITHSTVNA